MTYDKNIKNPISKVSIIGAGNVGSTFAYSLLKSGIAGEIVIIDKDKKIAEGQCLDLNHGASFVPPANVYAGNYTDCKGSDVVVVTAGSKQKPGESRLDLVQKNVEIFKQIIPEIAKNAPECVILIVTNPVDILTYVSLKISGFAKNKVLGSGTVLDSSRLRFLVSRHCKIDARNVHAYIIAEHGDTGFPVWSNAYVGGMLLSDYCAICEKKCNSKLELNNIFKKVSSAAYEIINLKGSTYYAISLALLRITEALIRDENSVLPISVFVSDFYQADDICLSIPSIVNRQGIRRFIKLKLAEKEIKQLNHSANTLKKVISKLKI